MEDSTTKGYAAGLICILLAIFFIIGSSWNPTTLAIGLFLGALGGGSLWKPDFIGQITIQLGKYILKNPAEQSKPRRKKEQKITQVIQTKGNVINVVDSKNTSTIINSPKKPRRKR
jgi:hypothetical protein